MRAAMRTSFHVMGDLSVESETGKLRDCHSSDLESCRGCCDCDGPGELERLYPTHRDEAATSEALVRRLIQLRRFVGVPSFRSLARTGSGCIGARGTRTDLNRRAEGLDACN